jgi:hypothetical protein
MTTTDDVFALYERNKNYYCSCDKLNVTNIKSTLCSEYCYLTSTVKPLTIGDQEVPCKFNRKIYIKPGEECAICLDGIITKTTAFLTPCGHAFHKECISKAYETTLLTNYRHNYACPCCRTVIGEPSVDERYHPSTFTQGEPCVNMDAVEAYWMHKNTRMPAVCPPTYNHYIGLKNDCKRCLNYRKTGEYYT